jgi:hypothetical protein
MTFQPPSMGVLAAFGLNSSTSLSVAGAATSIYEFLSESMGVEQEIVRTDGLRGTRVHPTERTRTGRRTPGGSISMQPTHVELGVILPKIIDSSGVSDTLPPYFQVVMNKVAKGWTFIGCKTSKARFSSRVGEPLALDWDIEAVDCSVGSPGDFSLLSLDQHAPFIFQDATLSLNSGTYQFAEVEIEIDWHLKLDRFMNSQTRTDLPSEDASVMLSLSLPYTSDTTGLWNALLPGASAGGSVTFNDGTHTIVFTFGDLIFPALRDGPSARAKDEILLPLRAEARGTGSTSPLVISTT